MITTTHHTTVYRAEAIAALAYLQLFPQTSDDYNRDEDDDNDDNNRDEDDDNDDSITTTKMAITMAMIV